MISSSFRKKRFLFQKKYLFLIVISRKNVFLPNITNREFLNKGL